MDAIFLAYMFGVIVIYVSEFTFPFISFFQNIHTAATYQERLWCVVGRLSRQENLLFTHHKKRQQLLYLKEEAKSLDLKIGIIIK